MMRVRQTMMPQPDSTSKPSILDVLEHYGASSLPYGGGWLSVHCPFHGDKRSSASVNVDEGVFKCFVCTNDTGDFLAGDAYAIVMQIEGVNFVEAKRRIQEWTGVSYGSVSPGHNT